MYKIGVIGDRDSVLGFKALGLDVFFEQSPEMASKLIHQLARDDYAIIQGETRTGGGVYRGKNAERCMG